MIFLFRRDLDEVRQTGRTDPILRMLTYLEGSNNIIGHSFEVQHTKSIIHHLKKSPFNQMNIFAGTDNFLIKQRLSVLNARIKKVGGLKNKQETIEESVIACVASSQDDRFKVVVSVGGDLWHYKDQKETDYINLRLRNSEIPISVAISPDGRFIVISIGLPEVKGNKKLIIQKKLILVEIMRRVISHSRKGELNDGHHMILEEFDFVHDHRFEGTTYTLLNFDFSWKGNLILLAFEGLVEFGEHGHITCSESDQFVRLDSYILQNKRLESIDEHRFYGKVGVFSGKVTTDPDGYDCFTTVDRAGMISSIKIL